MRSSPGFSLIELIIVCGIVASIALTTAGVTLANRAPAVSSTALRFDALYATAVATAHAFDGGATLAFEPDAYGDGFVARLYQQRPATGPLVASSAPWLEARVSVRETATLGAPAFAFALHNDGTLAGIPGDVTSATVAAETPCPASGAYQLVFSYAGATATRSLPCRTPLAANGAVTVVAPPAAVPLPLPTAPPCVAGACAVLPTPAEPSYPGFVSDPRANAQARKAAIGAWGRTTWVRGRYAARSKGDTHLRRSAPRRAITCDFCRSTACPIVPVPPTATPTGTSPLRRRPSGRTRRRTSHVCADRCASNTRWRGAAPSACARCSSATNRSPHSAA